MKSDTARIICLFLVLAMISSYDIAYCAPQNTLDLIDKIVTHHQARERLLLRSAGRCTVEMTARQISFQSRLDGTEGELWEEVPSEELGNTHTVEFAWKCRDNTVRYDLYIAAQEKDPDQFPNKNTRVVYDEEQCIYYDVLDERAYVNRPPIDAVGLTYISKRFDVRKLYAFAYEDIPTRFEHYIAKGKLPDEVGEVEIDGVQCWRFLYRHTKTKEGEVVHEGVVTLYFAPSLGYSLVKGDGESRRRIEGKMVRFAKETFAATYEEDLENPGTWCIRRVDTTVEAELQGKIRQERLGVEFHEIRLGTDIDDVEFTFEGMDVPLGTLVYDKRMGGEPVQLWYTDEGLRPISDDDPSFPERPSAMELRVRHKTPPDFALKNMNRSTEDGKVDSVEESSEVKAQPTPLSRLDDAPEETNLDEEPGASYMVYGLLLLFALLAGGILAHGRKKAK